MDVVEFGVVCPGFLEVINLELDVGRDAIRENMSTTDYRLSEKRSKDSSYN